VLTHTRRSKSRRHDLRYRTHQKQASLSLLDSRVEDIGSYEITNLHKNLRVCSHPATGLHPYEVLEVHSFQAARRTVCEVVVSRKRAWHHRELGNHDVSDLLVVRGEGLNQI